MPSLVINANKQASTTIPKELIDALSWKNGDQLLISKVPNQHFLTIENLGHKNGSEARK